MKTIDGLYFHEMVLLSLGILLFITLLILLVIYSIQKRKLRELILFFIVSIIMIGYPSIQKIIYDNGVLTIEKEVKLVAQKPAGSDQRSKIEKTLRMLEKRPTSSSKTLVEFGKAQAILGDTVKAEKLVDKALSISPDFKEAKDLQVQFNTPQVQIEKLITEIEENPSNTYKKEELEEKLSNFELTPEANSSVLTTAAKSYAMLGDTTKALSLANSALINNSKNTEAAAIRDRYTNRNKHR